MTGRRRRSVSARRQPVAALLSRRHPQGCEQARGGGFRLALPAAEIATIGDQLNDVLMFKRSGSASPWAMPRISSSRRRMSQRIPTMTRALRGQSSVSFCRMSVWR